MFKVQISSPIWLLCTLLSFGCCFTLFLQAQAAAVTDPNEVIAIKSLARKWNLESSERFNPIGDPCIGRATDGTPIFDSVMNPAIKCDCTFNNDATCHIVQMRVVAMDIRGEIPEELANLTYLWDLNLQQNFLTGPIPAFLGNLTSMRYLTLGVNHLSGTVPKELGNLHKLISLRFGANSLHGTLPPELGNLAALEQLFIDGAGVTGEIPSTFEKLHKLKGLRINDNQFRGGIPAFIGSLKNLNELRIQGNSFNGPIPSSFSNLISLTSLDLSFNNFTGRIPGSFQNLSNLEYLLLGNNNLSGELPSQKIASLVYIDLSYNQFSEALPTWISDNNLTMNIVGNYFSTNETNNRFPGRGLDCLQRTFPCNKGASHYSTFAINCGGTQKISDGTVYEDDSEALNTTSFYVSDTQKWGVTSTGKFMNSSNAISIATSQSQIALTLDLDLYLTARLSPSSLRYYGLGLKNGPYTVNLQFAEIQIEKTNSWRSVGRRIFDVYVQGQKVLTDFDVVKEAGSPSTAVIRSFNKIDVAANYLEIHFFWAGKGTCCIPYQGAYGPLVSAISVVPESKKRKAGIVIGITIGMATALICIILVLFLWRRRVQKHAATAVKEDEAINVIRSKLKIFSYADMKTATGDFDTGNKLGEGGYGAVYKGTLSDGEMVAVKQLSSQSKQGKREFINEIAVISAVQHRNLVKLHGYCLEADNQLLVYEYLENNSLAKALLGNEKSHKLDWPTRYNICIGIGRGLAYLHEESSTRIIHRDIKAGNILLDDSLNPKIADFGLAKLYDNTKTHISSTRIVGTYGYLAPEYAMRGQLTEKADVFSFGVLALELVSGRSNTDTSLPENMICLLEWTWHLYEQGMPLELIDPDIKSTYSNEAVLKVIKVALLCTQAVPTVRPSMSRVVAMLTSDAEVIPAASRPGYINDWQYSIAIAGATSSGSTPVVATTPMHKYSEESSPILKQDSLILSSAGRDYNSIKD